MSWRLKPNGEEMGVFVVSIDDGWVEWTYRMKYRHSHGSTNIEGVAEDIGKALGMEFVGKGKMRRKHVAETPAGALRVGEL